MDQNALEEPQITRLFDWGGGGMALGGIGGGVLGEVVRGPDSPAPTRWGFRGGIHAALTQLSELRQLEREQEDEDRTCIGSRMSLDEPLPDRPGGLGSLVEANGSQPTKAHRRPKVKPPA